MRSITILAFYLLSCSINAFSQCPKNTDNLYNRQKILSELSSTLKSSTPAYLQFSSGFFVYDLTEPSNQYIPKQYANAKACINFIDGHAYHFSPIDFSISQSNILFLESGKMRIFRNINCRKSQDGLKDVLDYAIEKFKNHKSKDEIIIRIKNYRRYGFYLTIDSYKVSCSDGDDVPQNLDRLYDRDKVLRLLARELIGSIDEEKRNIFPASRFLVEKSKANGFFIHDLTDPSNKQTSLMEHVEFKNKHVYHFAFIDLPFSYSHIVFLQDGELVFFRRVNCSEDQLQKAIKYLNENLHDDKDKILNRVAHYRNYGVYSSFDGLLKPQCK